MMNFNKLGKTKCKYCGCDDLHACKGGCFWVDENKTVCSSCAVINEVVFINKINKSKAKIIEANYDSYGMTTSLTVSTDYAVIFTISLFDFMDMFTEVSS